MGNIDWQESTDPFMETSMSLEGIIQYLRFRGDTKANANLMPCEAAELVQYIDQLRAINQTFAETLTQIK